MDVPISGWFKKKCSCAFESKCHFNHLVGVPIPMNFTNHLAHQKSTQRLQASEPTLETSVQAAFAKHVLEGAKKRGTAWRVSHQKWHFHGTSIWHFNGLSIRFHGFLAISWHISWHI